MGDTSKARDASDDPDSTRPDSAGSTLDEETSARIIAGIVEALREAGFECELDEMSLH